MFQLEFDSWKSDHIDGLVQDCSNSSALGMELLQFCILSRWQFDGSHFWQQEIASSVDGSYWYWPRLMQNSDVFFKKMLMGATFSTIFVQKEMD